MWFSCGSHLRSACTISGKTPIFGALPQKYVRSQVFVDGTRDSFSGYIRNSRSLQCTPPLLQLPTLHDRRNSQCSIRGGTLRLAGSITTSRYSKFILCGMVSPPLLQMQRVLSLHVCHMSVQRFRHAPVEGAAEPLHRMHMEGAFNPKKACKILTWHTEVGLQL